MRLVAALLPCRSYAYVGMFCSGGALAVMFERRDAVTQRAHVCRRNCRSSTLSYQMLVILLSSLFAEA